MGGRLNHRRLFLGGCADRADRNTELYGDRKAFGQPIDQFQGLQFSPWPRWRSNFRPPACSCGRPRWEAGHWAHRCNEFLRHGQRSSWTEACSKVVDQCCQTAWRLLAIWQITASKSWCAILRVHQILEAPTKSMRGHCSARARHVEKPMTVFPSVSQPRRVGHPDRPQALNAIDHDMLSRHRRRFRTHGNMDPEC